MALLDFLCLSLTPGVGPITIGRLVQAMGSAQRVNSASLEELQAVEDVGSVKAQAIVRSRKSVLEQANLQIEQAGRLGVNLICPDDEIYPPMLRMIGDAPAVLYVKGQIQPRDLQAVAIVGSRKCSFYGREQSERFAALLAGAGITVISGGARGIDSAAHRGALSHPLGRTIAVLGSGLDVPYPSENVGLFNELAQRGAVISEYAFGTAPTPENFPRRNRIISGMSRAVLVVEANLRSGALITARLAADDQNRPVLALPGRVDNPLSAGPHKLIRDGATLVTNLEEILESLGPLPDTIATGHATEPKTPPAETPLFAQPATVVASETQQILLRNLGHEPANVDRLIDLTNLPASQILQDLTLLTLRGAVKRVEGQGYIASK